MTAVRVDAPAAYAESAASVCPDPPQELRRPRCLMVPPYGAPLTPLVGAIGSVAPRLPPTVTASGPRSLRCLRGCAR
jgi:hypothetical protein